MKKNFSYSKSLSGNQRNERRREADAVRCSCCGKDIIQNLTFSEIIGVSKSRLPQTCSVCRAQFHLLEAKVVQVVKTNPFEIRGDEKKANTSFVYCNDCQEWKKKYPAYDFQHRAFYVRWKMQAWINRYKFMGDIRLAGTFAYKWTQIKDYPAYIYCPIPLSEKVARKRIQSSKRCWKQQNSFQMLLKESNICLLKQNTRKERLEMPQPFELAVPLSKIQHKILIIDDVYTTGQTLFMQQIACRTHSRKSSEPFLWQDESDVEIW